MSFEVSKSEQRAVWLPAALLIFLQLANGMRDLPQMAFFVIYLREGLELPPVTISSVVSGAQVAGMLTAILGGALISRFGSKWVLVSGLAFSALGSLSFQIHSAWLVAVLWVLGGAGLALTSVGSASSLTGIGGRGSMGTLAAFYALSMTIGGAAGNPLAGILIERAGFSAFSWMAIGISSVTVLLIGLLMPNIRHHGPELTDEGEPQAPRSPWASMQAAIRQPNARYLAGLRCLPTIFYGMLMVLIPLLLNDLSGSKVLIATYGTTNLIVASGAQLLSGRAADRWGARRPALAAYGLMIISGIGLAFSTRSVWGLFGFGVLGIAVAWALSTLMFVWIKDGVKRSDQPATFGMLHAVWSTSMIAGSMLGGSFAASLPWLPFLVAGGINIGSLVLITNYYRHGANRVKNA